MLRCKSPLVGGGVALAYAVIVWVVDMRFIHNPWIVLAILSGTIAWLEYIHLQDRRRIHHLRKQVQEAQQMESLGVLAGGIAHDFNNILASIIGNVDIMEIMVAEKCSSSDMIPYLNRIAASTDRATGLCQQMLAYSGRGSFTTEEFNLSDVVEDIVSMTRVSLSKKITIQFKFCQNLPPIEADITQVRQVIMNLIINGADAIGEGNVGHIWVSTGSVRAGKLGFPEDHLVYGEIKEDGAYVFMEVADTGAGLTSEARTRLFEPFFTTKQTGKGLGLSAVLGIMRGHEGIIDIVSMEGSGTRFTVYFPAHEGVVSNLELIPRWTYHTDSEFSCTEGCKVIPPLVQSNTTVLVVEDESEILFTLENLLVRMDIGALLARDGVEAIGIFKNEHANIDCVLLDLTMPRMDGAEVLREMQKYSTEVPVIIMSGYTRKDVTTKLLDLEIAGFLQKPYRLNDLRELLTATLRRKGDRDEC